MLHLAFLDQTLDRAGHILDWHARVDPMLVEEINHLDTQPLQRRVTHLADVLRPAVEAHRLLRLEVDIGAELCGNHHLIPHRLQRFTDHFLIGEGAIDLGGVEEGNATLYRRADQGDTFVLTERRT